MVTNTMRRPNHPKFSLEVKVSIPSFITQTHDAMVQRVRTYMKEPRTVAYNKESDSHLQSKDGLISYFHSQFNKALLLPENNMIVFSRDIANLHRKKSNVPNHYDIVGDNPLDFGTNDKIFLSAKHGGSETHTVKINDDDLYCPIIIDALLHSDKYQIPLLVARAYRQAVYNTMIHYKMNTEGIVFMNTTLAQITVGLFYSDFLMNKFHINDFGAAITYINSFYGKHEFNYGNRLFTVRKGNMARSKRKMVKI